VPGVDRQRRCPGKKLDGLLKRGATALPRAVVRHQNNTPVPIRYAPRPRPRWA
jgi:hypothetical protein